MDAWFKTESAELKLPCCGLSDVSLRQTDMPFVTETSVELTNGLVFSRYVQDTMYVVMSGMAAPPPTLMRCPSVQRRSKSAFSRVCVKQPTSVSLDHDTYCRPCSPWLKKHGFTSMRLVLRVEPLRWVFSRFKAVCQFAVDTLVAQSVWQFVFVNLTAPPKQSS